MLLCGGAINSPQLLQLSGVGAAAELRALGVDVVQDLPGVGENLQDHLEVYVQHSATQPVSMAPYFAMRRRPLVGLRWLVSKSGPGATNHFEAGGFVRSNDEVAYPNLMYHFLPIAVRYDGTLPPGGGGHGYQVHVGPDVLGRARQRQGGQLRSAQAPALRFNYLSTENDRREWVEAIRVTRKHPVAAGVGRPRRRRALTRAGGGDRRADPRLGRQGRRDRPAPLVHMPDGHRRPWRWWTRSPCGCAASTGLRVVDASVFPYVTNGNIYAPVMMTAEKSADLILGNTPLPPEPVEFYRHQGPAAIAPT